MNLDHVGKIIAVYIANYSNQRAEQRIRAKRKPKKHPNPPVVFPVAVGGAEVVLIGIVPGAAPQIPHSRYRLALPAA